MESSPAGITWEGFRDILYVDYRAHKVEDDAAAAARFSSEAAGLSLTTALREYFGSEPTEKKREEMLEMIAELQQEDLKKMIVHAGMVPRNTPVRADLRAQALEAVIKLLAAGKKGGGGRRRQKKSVRRPVITGDNIHKRRTYRKHSKRSRINKRLRKKKKPSKKKSSKKKSSKKKTF